MSPGLPPRTAEGTGSGAEARPPRLWSRYLLASGVTVVGVLSQYVIPTSWIPPGFAGFILGLLLVYGTGLAAFAWAFGAAPLRNSFRHSRRGLREGFRWYGIFGLLGLLSALVLAVLYTAFDPRYPALIGRSTPVLQAGSQDPLFYIVFSFFVGVVEETLFRGYLYGGLLRAAGTQRWAKGAVATSLVFTVVHVYYAMTYLEVSLLFYVRIFTLGLAFSFAYYRSGGNLWVIALLHGVFDATSFFGLYSSETLTLSTALSLLLIAACALYALVLYVRESSQGVGPGSPPEALRPFSAKASPQAVCPTCGAPVLPGPFGEPLFCVACGTNLAVAVPSSGAPPLPPSPRGLVEERRNALPPGAWPPP